MAQKRHLLKTWPAQFEAMWRRDKRFEYRRNDRGFKLGDILLLEEWDPSHRVQRNPISGVAVYGGYTSRTITAEVTYIAEGTFGIPPGFVVMSLKFLDRNEGDTSS